LRERIEKGVIAKLQGIVDKALRAHGLTEAIRESSKVESRRFETG